MTEAEKAFEKWIEVYGKNRLFANVQNYQDCWHAACAWQREQLTGPLSDLGQAFEDNPLVHPEISRAFFKLADAIRAQDAQGEGR